MFNAEATSALRRPLEMSVSTSVSLSVRRPSRLATGPVRRKCSMMRRATEGDIAGNPIESCVSWRESTAASVSFSKYPSAPAESEETMLASSPITVVTTLIAEGLALFRPRRISRPDPSGRPRSIRARSIWPSSFDSAVRTELAVHIVAAGYADRTISTSQRRVSTISSTIRIRFILLRPLSEC